LSREDEVSTKNAPSFRVLNRDECEAILGRNTLGRIAFSFHDRVDIEPIHFVHRGEWLYARTCDARAQSLGGVRGR
jgi:uncharacterized protein